jgi:DNA-directed RNA polymerase specialized sigma24 family protein
MNNQQFLTLVAGHRAGCKKSQEQLFEYMFSQAIIAFKKNNIGNKYSYYDVDDKLMDKIEYLLKYNYESTGNPTGLVFTSLSNVVRDYQRKNKNNITYTFSELDSFNCKKSDDVDDSYSYSINWIRGDINTDDSLYKNEKLEVLKRGIRTLPLSQREVMWLLLIERLTQEVVITVLKITNQQLYNLKCQGKIKLEKFIKKHGYRM